MTNPSPLSELAEWLAPAGMGNTSDVLGRRQDAVKLLPERLDVLDLVAIAYGIDVPALAQVEDAVAEADPAWLSGSAPELLRRVAAAALIAVLREGGPASVVAALGTGSAAYLGRSCPIGSVGSAASTVLADHAERARVRNDFVELESKPRRLLIGQSTLTELEGVEAVRALAKRFDEIVSAMQARVALLDEEIDALWWARRSTSARTNTPWSTMTEVERSITAAREILNLSTDLPPARGTTEVMRQVIGEIDSTKTVTLEEVSKLLSDTMLEASRDPHALLPLLSASRVAADFPGDVPAASAVLRRSSGATLQSEVPVAGLGEQVVREASIVGLLSQ